MPVKKLKEFLDSRDIKYTSISHSPANTAQQIAASAHIPGKELAKTVMIKANNEMIMAVLPASDRVDFTLLKEIVKAETLSLASEDEFRKLFPDCEPGAMPPFGNLYGIKVFVEESLAADEEIVFNAGSHAELMKMSYKDFESLVKPNIKRFSAKLLY